MMEGIVSVKRLEFDYFSFTQAAQFHANNLVIAAELDAKNLMLVDPASSSEGSAEIYVEYATKGGGVIRSVKSYEDLVAYEPEEEPEDDLNSNRFEAAQFHANNLVIAAELDAKNLMLVDPASSSEGSAEIYVEYAMKGGGVIRSVKSYEDLVAYEPEEEPEDDLNSNRFEEYDQEDEHEEGADLNGHEGFVHADADGIVYEGRPKPGRKRKVSDQSRADRKRLCNTNKTHINSKGRVQYEKVFDENFECSCLFSCTGVVPVNERRRIFSQYWSGGSFPARAAILMTCVTPKGIKRYQTKDYDNKKSGGYPDNFVIYGSPVCQKALLKTLQISDSRIYTAVNKFLTSATLCDMRGKFSGGRNALPESKKMEVVAHIASFPKYVSHYARNKTESKYLNADLNLAKLYRIYCSEADDSVSQTYYNNVFYTKFNLRFKEPKSDTCYRCDLYIANRKSCSGAELQMWEEWHAAHLKIAETLQSRMKEDLTAAKTDPELEVITYDMQKILQLPKVTTNIAYYKRQLNLYNFGIHIGSNDKGKFNLWTEDEASKGTQEVGSCLKLHIGTISQPIKKLILWSDSCGGQNRSIKLVLMMMHILNNHQSLERISLRYLRSGHSFLPNDREFGEFETALKGRDGLYTDVEYMKVMKECRKKNHFEVNRMLPENFFSVERLESLITNRKLDVSHVKVSWLETHEILIDKNLPGHIKMSKEIDGPYQTVNLNKIGCQFDTQNVVLSSLWPRGRPLSKEKVKDLRDMVEVVPQEHRYFYDERLNRIQVADFVDDVDGFGETIDFEVEEIPQ